MEQHDVEVNRNRRRALATAIHDNEKRTGKVDVAVGVEKEVPALRPIRRQPSLHGRGGGTRRQTRTDKIGKIDAIPAYHDHVPGALSATACRNPATTHATTATRQTTKTGGYGQQLHIPVEPRSTAPPPGG